MKPTFFVAAIMAIGLFGFGQNTRSWATYYGGSGLEYGFDVATDVFGNSFMTGPTSSTSSIASGGFQNTYGGGFYDAFLVKFDATGNRLWATYYGGTDLDMGNDVAIDSFGNIYLAGRTWSTSGIASGGFQNTYGGGPQDAFLVKFDPSGNRLWATYYGGAGDDAAYDVSVDQSGDVYLVGSTSSTSNISSGGFQNTYGGGTNDAFIVKFDASGNRIWATYYGGLNDDRGYSAVNDLMGNIFISGMTSSTTSISSGGFQNVYGGGLYDAFIVKFTSAGNPQWGTYYGGQGEENGSALSTDASSNIYMAGYTNSVSAIASGGFQNIYGGGLYDGYLVKFSSSGNRLWATYYGDTGEDYGLDVVTDQSKHVYLAGDAVGNSGFAYAGFQNTFGGGASDGFLARFDSLGTRICATYYGGNGDDYGTSVNLDQLGNVYLGGDATSTSNIAFMGFQNTYGGGQFDAFLAKFLPCLNIGIDDLSLINESIVYPNPSTGVFTITPQKMTRGDIEIYNSFGDRIFFRKFNESEDLTLDLSDLPKGCYFIRIVTDKKDFMSCKLLLFE